jgi:hypothetical protein
MQNELVKDIAFSSKSCCTIVDPIKRPSVQNLVAAIKDVHALNGKLGHLLPKAINQTEMLHCKC